MSPPAPPPPPSLPAKTNTAKSTPNDRNALLSSIHKGAKLKKAVSNDRSAPLVSASPSPATKSTNNGTSHGLNNASGSVGSISSGSVGGIGGLFPGGVMPKLKSSGSKFSISQESVKPNEHLSKTPITRPLPTNNSPRKVSAPDIIGFSSPSSNPPTISPRKGSTPVVRPNLAFSQPSLSPSKPNSRRQTAPSLPNKPPPPPPPPPPSQSPSSSTTNHDHINTGIRSLQINNKSPTKQPLANQKPTTMSFSELRNAFNSKNMGKPTASPPATSKNTITPNQGGSIPVSKSSSEQLSAQRSLQTSLPPPPPPPMTSLTPRPADAPIPTMPLDATFGKTKSVNGRWTFHPHEQLPQSPPASLLQVEKPKIYPSGNSKGERIFADTYDKHRSDGADLELKSMQSTISQKIRAVEQELKKAVDCQDFELCIRLKTKLQKLNDLGSRAQSGEKIMSIPPELLNL